MSTAALSHPRPRPTASAARRGRRDVASASESWGSVRLTRRGRLAVVVASLGLAVGGVVALSGPADSTGTAHHAAAHQVVVAPGETLWDIAQRIAPEHDTQDVIDDIVGLNSLASAGDIRAGQPLFVPEYSSGK